MKRWIGEVIELVLQTLCALVNHAGGCWLLNERWSPVRRLYWWSVRSRWEADEPNHGACRACGFDRSDHVTRKQHREIEARLDDLDCELHRLDESCQTYRVDFSTTPPTVTRLTR